jgi:YD repeat-containing protein
MTYITDAVRNTSVAFIRRAFTIVPLLLTMLTVTVAQDRRSVTDGSTPLGLTPGSPVGSYALSGFDNVNLFNGNLNYAQPLLTVGGRGEARYTITLQIDRQWQVDHFTLPDGSERTIDSPHDRPWGLRPGYGPGMLIGRQVKEESCDTSGAGTIATLTRLTFIAPDGTEYELRDQPGNGNIRAVFCASPPVDPLRGTVFGTADGTSMTFVSDSPIYDSIGGSFLIYPLGHLTFPNGLRYRIDNGRVTSIRDRNGNRLTFTYDRYREGLPEGRVSSITDSLNRYEAGAPTKISD